MKKKTPKRKPRIINGRFALAWFFLRKAVESLIRGKVII
jgi:hypothetical protein